MLISPLIFTVIIVVIDIDDVSRQYADAYGKLPVQTREFEIENEQMEKFWDQI